LSTPTYVHRRGDDRNPDLDLAMQPGVPPFLLPGTWEPQEILLPQEAFQPGLRPHVRDAALARAETEIARCNTALDALPSPVQPNSSEASSAESTPEVAQPITSDLNALQRTHLERDRDRWRAEAESIPARYHADWLTATDSDSDAWRQAVAQAARLDRVWEWNEALVALAQSELEFAAAPADKQSEAASKKKAAAELAEQKRKQIDAPGDRYRSLRGAEKTAESNLETEESRQRPFPERSTGRRTALAQWLTDHQNPLAARVAVNHIWNRHFHAPLVPTVFDFGRKGTPPSHPELLDNLALDWMRNGWSMKRLHRSLLTSSAYAMASSSQGMPKESLEQDPENRFYWRMNSGRMEAQAVRDSLLALGERLDRRLGGPSVPSSRSDSRRRSLYYFQSHNDHERFLSLFDDANVLDCYRRARSVVPQQALALQNSPQTQQACQDIVDRLLCDLPELDDQAFVQAAFQYLLGTRPNEAEVEAARKAMQRWRESAQSRQTDGESLARAGLVRSLINHNDFVTIR
jgi:hypothetical protein